MDDSYKKINKQATALLEDLQAYKIDIRFFAEQNVQMRYWIGAVLRNRFLYAAAHVFDEQGTSLLNILNTFALPEHHFLYKQLCGGFPKGFLFDSCSLPGHGSGFLLESDKVYSFSLIIIGNQIKYKFLFVHALKLMLEEGFGTPIVPLTIIDIKEEVIQMQQASLSVENVTCKLHFKTPVSLVQASGCKMGGGFQNKLNNFPSFYQFMRSLIYRLATLEILYSNQNFFGSKDEMDAFVDNFIIQSAEASLLSAEIKLKTCYSSPKIGQNNVYTMRGFTGTLCFSNVSSYFIPFILLGVDLGVGSNINYGLGHYDVTLIQ